MIKNNIDEEKEIDELLNSFQNEAIKNNNYNMSLDDINKIINEARKQKKRK